ncbi:hypothetical protein [Kitasatospora sp. McL0602]|uniref:hypothetical protein n=1 Tax=Kitasatospora sp. McL0602 TaxID=3439530 RepID=UPI003F8AA2BF
MITNQGREDECAARHCARRVPVRVLRSDGGHRRYSRYQLRIAMRARDLVDQGTAIDAACRIVILEDQLEEALRINEQLRRPSEEPKPTADT